MEDENSSKPLSNNQGCAGVLFFFGWIIMVFGGVIQVCVGPLGEGITNGRAERFNNIGMLMMIAAAVVLIVGWFIKKGKGQ